MMTSTHLMLLTHSTLTTKTSPPFTFISSSRKIRSTGRISLEACCSSVVRGCYTRHQRLHLECSIKLFSSGACLAILIAEDYLLFQATVPSPCDTSPSRIIPFPPQIPILPAFLRRLGPVLCMLLCLSEDTIVFYTDKDLRRIEGLRMLTPRRTCPVETASPFATTRNVSSSVVHPIPAHKYQRRVVFLIFLSFP